MSVSDPIADMLTRIRNAVMAGHSVTAMPSSKIKADIAKILKEEGFIKSYQVVDGERPDQKVLRIRLKYVGERRERRSVLTGLRTCQPAWPASLYRQTGYPVGIVGYGNCDLVDP